VMAVPTAFVLLCCAALSVTNDPYAHVLAPQIGYMQSAAPILIAMIAVGAPILVARAAADAGGSAPGAAASSELAILLVGWALSTFIGSRVAGRTVVRP